MTERAADNGERSVWHAMEPAQVLSALGVSEDGLGEDEARRRLEEHGPNRLPTIEGPSALRRFAMQFANVLIYVLLVAAAFTAAIGHWVDTAVILAVVLINALVGFIQEGKAERAMESIRKMLSPTATVLRDGEEREIEADGVVPGDLVLLRSGDRVPADLRIVYARNAQVEEAALTGESQPVDKRPGPVAEDATLGDRTSMAYSSTVVTSGRLRGVAVATGPAAEIGRISAMVARVERLSTPLLRKIDRFGRQLSLVILALSAALFVLGYLLRGFTARDMFMAVVGLAVAAIPEGLPAIMTITLALGVQHMARQNAIVRRLPAVETLGSVTVVCSDKTGTLTRNEMTVARVATAGRVYEVTGTGYAPHGHFVLDGDELALDQHPWLVELARAGMLANDARVRDEDGQWRVDGMPTEGSLIVLARKAGLSTADERQARRRLDAVPFESERRFMATLHRQPEGDEVIYVKGAPEVLLERCARQAGTDGDEPIDRDTWSAREAELADGGHRVLAIARASAPGVEMIDEDRLDELTLLGLVGIIDPPREEAIAAVAACRSAGIRVKMITGDHALTARSIARDIGIGDGRDAVTGDRLERASDEELVRLVAEHDVFARSSPEHKLRMIDALQSTGEVVAMTGDGVNDAPALKRADVGVAMGIKGSEAAKEASEMVLADDNFATIEQAVEKGRTIYDNLVKTILFILPTNGAESLIVIASVLIAFDAMPITPLQILWVNMVTAVTLALALAFEPTEEGIMERPPRAPDAPILSPYLIWRIAFVSTLIAAASLALFTYWRRAGVGLDEARTATVNTLVAGQLFYLFNSRYLLHSSLSLRGLVGNRAALIAVGALVLLQLGFTYLAPVQTLFGTAGITSVQWGLALLAGFGVFLIVEVEKAVVRRRSSKPGQAGALDRREPARRPRSSRQPASGTSS